MPAQMQDVAERAGVSVTTVSHVLNRTRPVARATEERVLAAARELKYYKNLSARQLATGCGEAFGLIISDIENPFFAELIKSFEAACLDRGREALLATTNYHPEQSRQAVRRMIESKARGVAVMTSQLAPELIEELTAAGTPVVALDSMDAGRQRSSVRVNYTPGARQAVRHLIELGHRSLGLLSGPAGRVSAVRYRRALLQAIARAKLPAPQIAETANTAEAGAAAVRAWAECGTLPGAILCGNDLTAFGAMSALHESGRQVPADVSVIGADDILFAQLSHPRLTTVRLPRDLLGRVAFDALERLARGRSKTGEVLEVKTQLVVRESTGQARR